MASYEELLEEQLERLMALFNFKAAAYRYCNHSKKSDKLWKEINALGYAIDAIGEELERLEEEDAE